VGVGARVLVGSGIFNVRFVVSTAVTMKNAVFWDVTPCGSCKNRHFGGRYCLHRQGEKNRAVLTTATRRHNPEDGILQEYSVVRIGSTQPAVPWAPGREADHSLPTSVEAKKTWLYTSTALYVSMAQLCQ
jgi:hypothetical protein